MSVSDAARLEALEAARKAWEDTEWYHAKERLEHARRMDQHGLFSVSQIAAICRLSPATVRKHGLGQGLREKPKGGRFTAEALSLLIILARNRSLGVRNNAYTITTAVNAGCSVRVISNLTGIPNTTLHRILEEK